MSLQDVKFIKSSHPFMVGDTTSLPKERVAILEKAGVVERTKIVPVATEEPGDADPPPPPPGASAEVTIPDDWESLHHQKIMALAKSINGLVYTSAVEAKAAIKDELARRAAAAE